MRILERIAAADPRARALTGRSGGLTFQALGAAAAAAALEDAPRVMIEREPPFEAAIRILAALRAGRPVVVLDPAWSADQRAAALAALPAEIPERDGAETLFYIGFTSGSSGAPKPFIRSAESWLRSFALDRTLFGLSAADVVAIPGKLSHSLGLYGVLGAWAAGAEALAPGDDLGPRAFASLMRARGATVLTATPTQLVLVARALDGETSPDLRIALCGGAALSQEAEAELARAFPNAVIAPYYGASELSYVAFRQAGAAAPAGSVGRAAPGARVTIRDAAGAETPIGEVGRVVVESNLVAAGYLTPDGLAPLPRLGGGVALGDLGRVDAEGFLFIEGRADRMLIVSGRNIAPERIEAALEAHPAIASAAVFGLEDGLRGARLAAVIGVEGDPPAERAIRDWIRARLGAAETPSRVFLAPEWPRLGSGKTDFAALRARIEAGGLERLA